MIIKITISLITFQSFGSSLAHSWVVNARTLQIHQTSSYHPHLAPITSPWPITSSLLPCKFLGEGEWAVCVTPSLLLRTDTSEEDAHSYPMNDLLKQQMDEFLNPPPPKISMKTATECHSTWIHYLHLACWNFCKYVRKVNSNSYNPETSIREMFNGLGY
jgi:hypothetical protein